MKGFQLNRKGETLESVKIEENMELSLLSKGDGVELVHQLIEKDKLFYVYPSDNPLALEFYYVLSGEAFCELGSERKRIGAGDYFTARNLEEPVHFTAESRVELLCAFTEQTFVYLSEDMSSLMEIKNKVEQKDPYTHRHSERVAKYSVQIAREMKLRKEVLENLTIAAVIHDIGKVHVPNEILNKPDRLTDEEFEIIKKHPLDGADMLKGTSYEELSPIIEQHHERLDGSGYPYGKLDHQIPIESKIIAVSDTFDAMTKDRAYRKAFSIDDAVAEIVRLKGSHYDAEVVEALVTVLNKENQNEQTSVSPDSK
ncbi:HD-GYP domain-containing protein [Halobacillus sp. Nhm2S1]|uniref:HD-GYP domain-containing protein n=1 Tax=Halobacillus sp. Nhm2S1 TaxID=2866716 RepID=UPI001C739A1F|nr:HD domain-containing phosphohydrolase [Halobacillus sp. Nhm2S1]MBX0359483.1 HD domain-containing protein [Halobacillus sp. Nhm2S1]